MQEEQMKIYYTKCDTHSNIAFTDKSMKLEIGITKND